MRFITETLNEFLHFVPLKNNQNNQNFQGSFRASQELGQVQGRKILDYRPQNDANGSLFIT
jgi:hypothetical protein